MQNIRYVAVAAVAVATAAAMSACSSSGGGTQTSTSASATAAQAAKGHISADVMFAKEMIPHHRQAIEMSDMLLAKEGIDPRVVSLATDIKAAQTPQIEQMQGWLSQWGFSATTSSAGGGTPSMPGDDRSKQQDMPGMSGGHGMMSEQDVAALQNAQGVAASKLFLSQMIEHHNGTITMAQSEVDSGQFPAAVALARSIVATQQQEITTMQGLLAEL
nr:DUF305 domain-containing protein [Mycobacteroides chelonae]